MVIIGMPRMVYSPDGQSWKFPCRVNCQVAEHSPAMADRQGDGQSICTYQEGVKRNLQPGWDMLPLGTNSRRDITLLPLQQLPKVRRTQTCVDRTNETSLGLVVANTLSGQAQVTRRDAHIIHGGENRQGITSRIIS
jgi:hypothetical protein